MPPWVTAIFEISGEVKVKVTTKTINNGLNTEMQNYLNSV